MPACRSKSCGPAHYALCASLDDIVQNSPWGSHGAWAANSLVATFHQRVEGGEGFFDLLAQMRQYPGKFLQVLELMYLCMSLGYMGEFRVRPRGPAELDKLREEVYELILRQRQQPAEPELVAALARRLGPVSAGARRGAGLGRGQRGLGRDRRPVRLVLQRAERTIRRAVRGMLAAPLSHMPKIARVAPVQPPPPPPPAAEPTSLDKLRTFLKPEIDEGLVKVLGTPSTPIVRIRNGGLFASGSATVQQRFHPLLERIGAALKQEPGKVQVIGYTDNQPIRTVRFPSNFQLSTARAEAARVIIAQTIGDASRMTAEGRADADPIASNATREGREENRRIEVVLHRAG